MEVIVIDTPLNAKLTAVGAHLITTIYKHDRGELIAEEVNTSDITIGGCPVVAFRLKLRNAHAAITVIIQVDQSIIEVTDVPTLVHMVAKEAIAVINDK